MFEHIPGYKVNKYLVWIGIDDSCKNSTAHLYVNYMLQCVSKVINQLRENHWKKALGFNGNILRKSYHWIHVFKRICLKNEKHTCIPRVLLSQILLWFWSWLLITWYTACHNLIPLCKTESDASVILNIVLSKDFLCNMNTTTYLHYLGFFFCWK